ncbi:MAG TPA: T9SS type A sorting domain-containing protein [Flavobacteriales bacterium]|nr:T9SS type A sorting domain-containing protein [Flavobacteriales bacterium]
MKKRFTLSFIAATLFCNLILAQDTTNRERIYLGTGEYSPGSTWDAIIRLDTTENFDSEPGAIQYSPEGTVPLKSSYIGGTTFLNFGHGLYYDESNDRMFVATIFTNLNNYITENSDTAVGAIAIFDNMSTLDGGTTPTRYIFGPSTQLKQPHGCWLDESRDMLYVSNTFGENILVFNNASTISGDVAPDRVIAHDSLGCPVYIFIDSLVDRMFVCAMPAMGGPPTSLESQVAIYNNASTQTGSVEPLIRITGDNTRLMLINQTVHNAWFNPTKQLLAVGHHTNELLMFDLTSVSWSTVSPLKYDLIPRIIRVDDPSLGYDSVDVNLYGFYWDLATDRMFCSVGVDNPGGGPTTTCPPESIKIFSNVSDSTVSGVTTPDRVIYWSNCSTYFPPQPIWLHKYQTITSANDAKEPLSAVRVFPNPATTNLTIAFKNTLPAKLELYNALGEKLLSRSVNAHAQTNETLDVSGFQDGIVFMVIYAGSAIHTEKIIIRQ